MHNTEDTIVAIASAQGGALRGILRVSGPQAITCLDQCFETEAPCDLRSLSSAQVVAGSLLLDEPLGAIPCDAYVWPTSRSYTRQPACELHTVGSPPILDAAVRAVCRSGARPAQPGEFTMRAFLAGRLDLTQAEAVLGVIDARDEQQLGTALEQLAGNLANPLHALRERLLDLLAHLEAGLDFVEEDIEFISAEELARQLSEATAELEHVVARLSARGDATTERRVVLVGEPNVGKSSLFNALTSDSAAIVSNIAGTTSDYLVRRIELGGHAVLLVDTAGLAPAADDIAADAQSHRSEQLQRGDVRLLCIDSTRPLNRQEQSQLDSDSASTIVVLTKCDRPLANDCPSPAVRTSSYAGQGVEELRRAIATQLDQLDSGDAAISTASRCQDALGRAADSLERARGAASADLGEELVAAELRGALDELGAVVGVVYTDDILDRIFGRFCIGK